MQDGREPREKLKGMVLSSLPAAARCSRKCLMFYASLVMHL
jgi:hypothetical protein